MSTTDRTRRVEVTPRGRPAATVAVAYERHGAGEPLVLLHGLGHHRRAWDPVIGALAERREVIAVDLPGFGRSPAPPEEVASSLENAVAVLSAFFTELGIVRPHVAGNSLGGLIALRLALAGRVRTATALSPGGFWTAPDRLYTFTLLRALRRGALTLPPRAVERLSRTAAGRTALTGVVYARPGRRDPAAVVAETAALREAAGFDAALAAGSAGPLFAGRIDERIPVTVGWGDRDRLLPRRQGLRVKRAVPHARLVRLPGCGHVPMNDDPELVARVLLYGSR